MRYDLLVEYQKVNEQMKVLKARKEELSNAIKEDLVKNQVNEMQVKDIIVKKSYRDHSKIDDTKLEDMLKSKGLWDVATKLVADEDRVMELVSEGTLTNDDIKKCMNVDIRYQLSLKGVKSDE